MGYVTSLGQLVHYNFTLPSASTVYFDSQTDNSNFYWSLTGASGTMVSSRPFTSSDANRGNPIVNLPAGTYQLTVGASGAATGAFNFRLLNVNTTTTLTPGTPVSVTLNPGNATNAYSFTATAGERVFFDAQGNIGGSIYIHVFDPLGRDLYGAIYAGSLPSFGVRTLALAGTYTVLVDADVYYDPDLSQVTFNVIPVVDKSATLTLGTAVTGSIDTPGQASNYTFTVASQTRAYFDSLTNDSNLVWTLTGPSGTLISSRSFTNSDSYDQGSVELDLAPGNYTLSVTRVNDSTGAFSFNLLDFAQATALAANTPTPVSLPAMTTRLYSFGGNVGDRVELFSSVVSGDVAWRLIDPNGQQVFGPQWLGSEPAAITLTSTGTYTLAIEGRIYTNSPISATLKLIPVGVPGINGAVTAQVPAVQSTPVDLGYFAAGTYHIAGAGVASLVSNANDPNSLLFNPDGTPEVPVTRSGWAYLNQSRSPLAKPVGSIHGPGGSTTNLGALMGTLTASPSSPAAFFTIGSGTDIVLATARHISALINDTYYPDNQYGYEVTVTPVAVASGATTQTFDSPGIPYSLSTYGGQAATIGNDGSGNFLRLTSASTTNQNNVADFSSTTTWPHGSVQVDFDFRITPGTTRGLGIGAVLLDTPT